MKRISVSLFAILFLFAGCAKKKEGVPYPDGYKQWKLLKSALYGPGDPLFEPFGGIHHIYVNPEAAQAIESGQENPDGAIVVFDLYEAVAGPGGDSEGPHKLVAVMIKDKEQFKDTGGWGFDAFKGDTQTRLVQNAKTDCFACHASQKGRDFLFSGQAN